MPKVSTGEPPLASSWMEIAGSSHKWIALSTPVDEATLKRLKSSIIDNVRIDANIKMRF